MFVNTQLFYGLNDLKQFLEDIHNISKDKNIPADEALNRIDNILEKAATPLIPIDKGIEAAKALLRVREEQPAEILSGVLSDRISEAME